MSRPAALLDGALAGASPAAAPAPGTPDAAERRKPVVEYYSEAGPDFGAWSPVFNMHFGYRARGQSPLRLEPMLEQMNREVAARLALDPARPCELLDLGCGLGATARSIAARAPLACVTGVTIVPWQIEQGRRLSAELAGRVRFVLADYTSLPFADGSVDGVYAVESACYGSGPGKADLVGAAARVLRPGGRLVIADALRKHSRRLNPVLRRCHATVCRYWRVDDFAEKGALVAAARQAGFADVVAEDVSWRVAPSVAYVPLVTARFLWREWIVRRARLTRPRLENALAPLLGMLLGAARSAFGYYLVTARRA